MIYQLFLSALDGPQGPKLKFVMLVLVLAFPTIAQERKVDPTWLHRYVPHLREVASKMSLESCHFKPIFGEGDSEAGLMQSVTRFAEVTIDPNGNCQPVLYDREETAGSDTSSAAFDKVMEAITNRDNQTLARLLAATPGIANQTGRHPRWGGRPQPLHVAIESDNHQALALLLDTGANVDGDNRDYDGWSPLMIAVHWQRVAMREELIRRGATIDLIAALMLGDDRRVAKLLKDSAVLQGPFPNDAAPLHFARTVKSARLLLAHGMKTDAQDKYGKTAPQRWSEARRPSAGLVRLAASLGLKPPLDIYKAVEAGRLALVRKLLADGADVRARFPTGSQGTLLHNAAWNGDLSLVKLLVAKGADLNAVDQEHKTTPAHWARVALKSFSRWLARRWRNTWKV